MNYSGRKLKQFKPQGIPTKIVKSYMNSPFLFTHLSDPWQWKLCLHTPEDPNCLKPSSASSAMSMSATSTTSLITSYSPTWFAVRPVAPSAASWLANRDDETVIGLSLNVIRGWILKLRGPLCLFVGLFDGLRPNRALATRPKTQLFYPFCARV